MSKFLAGSTYFFSEYPDFKSEDIDEVEIVDTDQFKHLRQISGRGRCLFQVKKQSSTEAYIQSALTSNLGMTVGKFLIPEFCRAISLEISDLPKLQPLIEKLDTRHLYEKIIFESYLENKDFKLTKAQKDLAYKNYKESRGL